MHPLRNALAALLLLPCILLAAPPLEWPADLSSPEVWTLYARHGETRDIRAALRLAGRPYAPESARCHYSTNGIGGPGWDAPVSVASNVATVAWSPSIDPGGDLVSLLLEIDGTYSAAAHLHLRPGPSGGSALPPPTAVLDFATQPYTNAPWALPSDIPPAPDLSAYATTGHVAEAIAAIPAPDPPDLTPYATTGYVASAIAAIPAPDPPDLSAYATTGHVAGAVAAMHPDFQEWASPTVDRIFAEAVPASTSQTNRGDAVATFGRTSGYALRAVRSTRSSAGMDTETEIEGAWSIVGDDSAATLATNVLSSTTRPGDVTVEFTPADGSATMRAAVSMPGDAVRTSPVWPAAEGDSWRFDVAATQFMPDNPDEYTITTSRWNNATCVCTNWVDGMLTPPYWYAAPGVDSGGGLVGIAPHYALSSAHCGEYGPRTWVTGAPSGRGKSIATFGDLMLLRMPVEVPAMCRAKLLRASILATRSDSLLFRALGNVHTQHGCVLPCLLEPRNRNRADLSGLDWDSGWTYVGVDREWRNATHAWLRPYSHAAHGGDSGHPVWFQLANVAHGGGIIPVGLFHWADGAGECLLSDSLLDKIDAAIRRDSGGAESLTYYTAEDLQ